MEEMGLTLFKHATLRGFIEELGIELSVMRQRRRIK
jgi:hypothetical protein